VGFKGKRVTVVGLARSGAGAANLLSGLGADVTVTDTKTRQQLGTFPDNLSPEVKLELGGHPVGLFENSELIVVSPGVPMSIPPLKTASEKGIKIIGELELAYQIITNRRRASGPYRGESGGQQQKTEFLAVTGTNGKSTTSTLLYEMLKNSGTSVLLVGNIGNALTEALLVERDALPDCFVVEVSSFQLETIDEFRPGISAILNITPDHLDRYHSMPDYIDAKCRVFSNQKEGDVLILNADDPMTGEIIKRGRRLWGSGNAPAILYFSRTNKVKGAYCKDDIIYFDLPDSSLFTLHPSSFLIKGVHNMENAMAASLMALLAGCSPDSVARTLEIFPGLEHRLEFVREIDGVRFINDSKGTNVGAVLKSLEGFKEPVVLIAGGRDKDSDFSELAPLVREKVKALVLIGEARDKIKKALGDVVMTYMEDDFSAAIFRAKEIASRGDVVLLSPACASFDMFRDFEDRGRQFKKVVMGL